MIVSITVPTKMTLNKYGLTPETWQVICDRQRGACGACGKVPKTNRLVIDHEHVRGWKAMPTKDRPQYVRGMLCYMCNHYRLARGATAANLRGAANYLDDYVIRKTPLRKHWVTTSPTPRSSRERSREMTYDDTESTN